MPFTLVSAADDVFVRQGLELVEGQRPVRCARAQVADVSKLLRADADRTKAIVGRRCDRDCGRAAVEQRRKARLDGRRGFRRELLRDDGVEQRAKRIGALRLGEPALAELPHQVPDHRVAARQYPPGLRVVRSRH